MKRVLLSLFSSLLMLILSAQAPQAFKYQTVVRNASNAIMANKDVYFRISILQGSSSGTVVYAETFSLMTNDFGLAAFNIGQGSVESGSFAAINWSSHEFWVKVELDPDAAGTATYEVIGTSQLVSVPYALDAKTAENAYWVKNVNDISYNSGNIGIGISNPIAKLDLRGTMYAAGTNPFGTFTFVETTDSHADVHESILTVQNISGSVSSQANIKFDAGPEGHGKAIISGAYDGSDENGKLTFKVRNGTTSYVNALTLRSSGNVGINETNPDAKLHVNGNAHVTGNVSIDGKVTIPAAPVDNTDAVNKAYIALLEQRIRTLENNLIEAGTYKLEDIEGNQYEVIEIGTQVWMADNLKTTKYNDGTSISFVEDGTAWSLLTTGAYCWYNNDPLTADPYGALYNWFAVETNKLCPSGWHVATNTEWNTLITFLGGASVAGGKLKEAGTAHWNTDSGATNSSGFTALPNYRGEDGMFHPEPGKHGLIWTSTMIDANLAYQVRMDAYDNETENYGHNKKLGQYVRCIKE